MTLTGTQIEQTQAALEAAFDRDALRQLMRMKLGVSYDAIVAEKGFQVQVGELVGYLDRQGRISELIAGALEKNANNDALLALAEAAKSWHIEPPAEPDAAPPYQGLNFFDTQDAERFFGREALADELVDYLKDHRFLAVVGGSGSGKSSVVRAAVIPALQQGKRIQGSGSWRIAILTPTAKPLLSLASKLIESSESLLAAPKLADEMAGDKRILATYLLQRTQYRAVVIIDQFEEMFTLCENPTERKAFVDNLLAAVDNGTVTIILTLRSDFYARCDQFDNLRLALQDGQKYIGQMSPDELCAATEKPAAKAGWVLEQGLTNRLLKDVANEPGSLPLLSHALLETWKRRSGNMLTLAGYEASGGVQGAIARTADDVLSHLSAEQKTIARNVFVRLTSLDEGVREARRRVLLDELTGGRQESEKTAVINQLENARLVVVEKQQIIATDGTAKETIYVDVVHEALIREWPELRKWLDEDRDGQRLHRRLTNAAREWEHSERDAKRDDGLLFRGTLLAQATEWAHAHDGDSDFNDHERAFLQASQDQEQAERSEKERVQREREEAQRRELQFAQELREQAEARQRAEAQRAEAAEAREKAEEQSAKRAIQDAVRLRQRTTYLYWALGAVIAVMALAAFLGWQYWASQEGARLISESSKLAAAGKFDEAVDKYRKALATDPTITLRADDVITGTIRDTATAWVRAGEAILAGRRLTGTLQTSQPAGGIVIQPQYLQWAASVYSQTVGAAVVDPSIRRGAIISATALFSQALALNPPSEAMMLAGEAILAGRSLTSTAATQPDTSGVTIQPQYLQWAESIISPTVELPVVYSAIRRDEIISATALFSQALALNPPSDTLVYVYIPPGSFTMGTTSEQCARAIKLFPNGGLDCTHLQDQAPVPVAINTGYWIMRTEVTNAEYIECKQCQKLENNRWKVRIFANQPVNTNWLQANEYAKLVGGRLPTREEWEYACGGVDKHIFPWGDYAPNPDRLNSGGSELQTPVDVGSYPPGANGLYDMVGNLGEWTNSPMPNGNQRAAGGSFFDNLANILCAAGKSVSPSEIGYSEYGFRVVIDP